MDRVWAEKKVHFSMKFLENQSWKKAWSCVTFLSCGGYLRKQDVYRFQKHHWKGMDDSEKLKKLGFAIGKKIYQKK